MIMWNVFIYLEIYLKNLFYFLKKLILTLKHQNNIKKNIKNYFKLNKKIKIWRNACEAFQTHPKKSIF